MLLVAATRRLSGAQAGASEPRAALSSLSGGVGQQRALLARAAARPPSPAFHASPTSRPPHLLPSPWRAGLASWAGRPASATPHASATTAPSSPRLGPAAAAGIEPEAFVVVNFYHLVDVAAPGRVRA